MENMFVILGIGSAIFLEIFFMALMKVSHESEIVYLKLVEERFGEIQQEENKEVIV